MEENITARLDHFIEGIKSLRDMVHYLELHKDPPQSVTWVDPDDMTVPLQVEWEEIREMLLAKVPSDPEDVSYERY